MTLGAHAQAGPQYREVTQDLGIVNGTVVANQMVEIIRPLPNPVLFRVQRDEVERMPTSLILRGTQSTIAPEGTLLAKVRWSAPQLADGRERLIEAELPLLLRVDGKEVRPQLHRRADDLELTLPIASQRIELICDGPIQFRVPVGYRGKVSLVLDMTMIIRSDAYQDSTPMGMLSSGQA
nr:DUF5462 family protein [Chromobacterium violaceum]